MRYLLLLLCIIIACHAKAQKSIRYSGSAEGGLMMGSKLGDGFVFTSQGIAYKQYIFGVGTGLDFYGLHSVPLFADVKRKFSNKATQPFIQVAGGLNFTNSNSRDAKDWFYNADGKYSNGFFAKGGGGLIFRAKKKVKITLSAGYSYKTSTFTYTPFVGNPWEWQLQPVKNIYHYNRWYFSAGVMW